MRKKLQGYVGFANLPNQVHRKSVKKGFQFTCMVVGKVIWRIHIKKGEETKRGVDKKEKQATKKKEKEKGGSREKERGIRRRRKGH